MREIKFRAWDRKNKKFLNYPKDLRMSTTGGLSLLSSIAERDSVDIHQIEILQYTGLKDCLGKEIYEGDILCIVDNVVVETIGGYDRTEPEGTFITVTLPDFYRSEWYEYCPEDCEIIGNIYESPDLLK